MSPGGRRLKSGFVLAMASEPAIPLACRPVTFLNHHPLFAVMCLVPKVEADAISCVALRVAAVVGLRACEFKAIRDVDLGQSDLGPRQCPGGHHEEPRLRQPSRLSIDQRACDEKGPNAAYRGAKRREHLLAPRSQ